MQKQILRTRDLAARTGMSEAFWYKRRLAGDGPEYFKLGDAPAYDWDTVRTWLEGRKRKSTSEIATSPGADPARNGKEYRK
jgi:predicted DNA-binding transcriptional regulator AlpA